MGNYTVNIIVGYMPIIIIFSILLIVKLRIKSKKQTFITSNAIVPYSANNEQKHQHQQAKYYYNFHIYENRYNKKYSNNSGYKKYNHKEEDIIDAEII